MAFEVCCPLRRNNDSTMFILPEKIVTAALMELVFTDFFSLTPQMQLIVLCIGTVLVILAASFLFDELSTCGITSKLAVKSATVCDPRRGALHGGRGDREVSVGFF